MNNSSTNRLLALINILIVIILVADTFIFQPRRQAELFDHYETTEALSSETGTHEYFINYLYTVSGERLREPFDSKYILNPKDTFYIDRSFIFSRPIIFLYKIDGRTDSVKSGVLNQGFLGIVILAFIFFVSIINVFPKLIIRRPNLNERLLFCGISFLAVAVFFYFY